MDPLIKKTTSQKKRIKGNDLFTVFINHTCTAYTAGFPSLRFVPQPFTRSVVKFCSFCTGIEQLHILCFRMLFVLYGINVYRVIALGDDQNSFSCPLFFSMYLKAQTYKQDSTLK